MVFKLILLIFAFIIVEIYNLLNDRIVEHKYAFGLLKVLLLNTLIVTILFVKSFYFGIFSKIKEIIPPIIKTATKVLTTPLKSPSNNQH